jgi:hypothetical protein
MAATSYNLHIGQNQVKWSIDAIVLKKVKLVCYTCAQHCSCAVLGLQVFLDTQALLRNRGVYVRTQKWQGLRYMRLKARSANLVLILDMHFTG